MSTLLPGGPKAPNIPNNGHGKYSIKATSRIMTRNGRDYIKIRGYDFDMSIVEKVDNVTKLKAFYNDMFHTETEITFMFKPIPFQEGTVFLDYVDANKTILVP